MEKKAVVGEKCSRCGKVLAADTTLVYGKYTKNSKGQLIFTNNKDKRDAYIVNNKNDNTITRYNYKLCEDCEKAKADSFFVLGKKEYRNGNYNTALHHFREAKKLGQGESDSWIKKAAKKEAEIERREERKRERERREEYKRENRRSAEQRIEARRKYAKVVEALVIKAGIIDPRVRVNIGISEKDSRALFVGDLNCHSHSGGLNNMRAMRELGIIGTLKELGFTSVVITDAVYYVEKFELKNW